MYILFLQINIAAYTFSTTVLSLKDGVQVFTFTVTVVFPLLPQRKPTGIPIANPSSSPPVPASRTSFLPERMMVRPISVMINLVAERNTFPAALPVYSMIRSKQYKEP